MPYRVRSGGCSRHHTSNIHRAGSRILPPIGTPNFAAHFSFDLPRAANSLQGFGCVFTGDPYFFIELVIRSLLNDAAVRLHIGGYEIQTENLLPS